MDRWVGRVAIVTGASAGIGAAIATLLAERGMKVVGVARRVERVQALAAGLGKIKGELHAIQGDITKEDDVLRVVKWTKDTLGGADVLVNNAGVLHKSPLLSGSTADWKHQLDVNVLAVCVFTREVVKCMRERKVDDGHIININSVMGHYIFSYEGMHLYSATKHAITVLTEGLRRELSAIKSRIRITSLSPALTRTEIQQAAGVPDEVVQKFLEEVPSLNPRDVAEALEYALSAPASVDVEELTIRVTCAGE